MAIRHTPILLAHRPDCCFTFLKREIKLIQFIFAHQQPCLPIYLKNCFTNDVVHHRKILLFFPFLILLCWKSAKKSRGHKLVWTRRAANLLGLGIPTFSQQVVEAVELNFLRTAQHRPDASRELLGYLKLVVSQWWPLPRQQLIQNHTIGEHVHLYTVMMGEKQQEIKVRI